MKHHIVIKFLAIFLCAASLLGAAASGLGLFAVSELGLREQTLTEAYADSVYTTAEGLANELAVRYASRELGGAADSLIDSYYGSHWLRSTFDWDQVAYVIRDEEGRELESRNFPAEFGVQMSYSIGTGGSRYLQILNTMTQEEYEQLYNSVIEPSVTMPVEMDGETYAYLSVNANGCDISKILVTYSDGSTGEYSGQNAAIGRLSWFMGEQLRLDFYNYEYSPVAQNLTSDLGRGYTMVGIVMVDTEGTVVLNAADPGGLLEEFSRSNGIAYVLLRPLEETGSVELGEIYDAIPPEGQFVNTLTVQYASGYEESVGGEPDIGFLGYDEDGFVVFTANEPGLLDWRSEPVFAISFSDGDGYLVYEARDYFGVGQFQVERDTLIFRSREPGENPLPSVSGEGLHIYDDVPPGGYAVYRMDLWLDGQSELMTIEGETEHLGLVDHDSSGNVIFTASNWKDFVFSKPAQVRYILMTDLDGRVLYEAYQQGQRIGAGDPIGYFAYDESGKLVFGPITGSVAAAAVAETSQNASASVGEARNVHVAPNMDSTVIDTVEAGTPVEILDIQVLADQEWGKIENGWILLNAGPIPEATEGPELTDESTTVDPTEEPVETTETAATEVTEPAVEEEAIPSTEPTYAVDTTDVTELGTVPTEAGSPYAKAVQEDTLRVFGYYDSVVGEEMVAEYTYAETPPYTVEIMMGPGALSNNYEWVLMGLVYQWMDYLIPALIVGLVLFAITAVYLCCAAGKAPGKTEIRAGGLNRMPLDLYLAAAAGGACACGFVLVEGGDYLLRRDIQTGILLVVLCAYAACLLFVGFCFAFAAQVKTPDGFLWRNTVVGRSGKILVWLWDKVAFLCGWLWRFCREKGRPLLVRIAKAGWKLTKFFCVKVKTGVVWLLGKVLRGCKWLNRVLGRFLSLLPLTWQFLLIGFSLVIFLYIMIRTYKVGYLLIGFGVFFGVILYAASAFGILLENTKRMRKGDLDSKVDDKLLIGAFREFSEELNGLADVAVVAAQKQLKSERMKTELITNVSHDIKTPLTSIINYVDLMEKPHSPEEQAQYLEVLARQSQRLKKLVDDLMEMSKASTGNMAVEITRVNAGEAVNQALGEFGDKLEKAQLIPVFRQPEKEILMMADGRLVWRVLSNLLSNAVKYALPGTRLYIDLLEADGKVVLSLKNISRESLNVSADELLERFVRGDTARNTEGSGLGLNIAQSLMQLQKGKLELLVDGDLFKVTLIFPGV